MSNYKSFAVNLAKRAGKVIKANFKNGMKKQWKKDGTPLTVTDTKINQMVIEAVKKHFPTHDVLAEEGSSLKNKSKYLWVCDPVDGTIPFSHGIPVCVFSLALVVDGKPVLGAVYDPFMDRMYFAEKGKGAFLNGKRIHVSKNTTNKGLIDWEDSETLGLLKKIKGTHSITMKLDCVIYAGMLVASGELVAALYSYPYAHDVASLKIIVEEAGGKVTDIFGREQRYDRRINGGLISNGVVHNQLLKVSKKIVMKR